MKQLIPESAKGVRLDRFLTETRPERSRSFWQKEIKAGRVTVNGKKVPPHYFLKGGEEIEIGEIERSRSARDPGIEKKTPEVEIIADEPTYLIINKPVGLLVHPTDRNPEPTLTDILTEQYPEIKKVGNAKRPGIVQRLDKLTSGVMVVAKTQEMYEHLKHQFADRTMEKEYRAFVVGKLPKDTGEITLAIGRSRQGGRMAARPRGAMPAFGDRGRDRTAKTIYEVIERLPTTTLVRVKPETGRTHQIRAHFFALGHPIVGDPLYKTREQKKSREVKKSEVQNHERLMLHATKLSFTDLEGNRKTYEVPPPTEFHEMKT